ncbi:MAG: PH domain-containing protein [Phycisphaerae bacterium]|nr:PH domain-containing protein [Phycisphaerae bacterium]
MNALLECTNGSDGEASTAVEALHKPTATLPVRERGRGRHLAAATKSGESQPLAVADLVPEHLLDGGEVVLLAIKPSLWFIPFVTIRWLIGLVLVIVLAPRLGAALPWADSALAIKAAAALAAARVGFAVLEWASRLYVLTNRRVMRIRGIFNVNLFECSLLKIQNTNIRLTWYERFFGLGTILIATAGTGTIEAEWLNIAHPLEVHEQIRAAIHRARGSRSRG